MRRKQKWYARNADYVKRCHAGTRVCSLFQNSAFQDMCNLIFSLLAPNSVSDSIIYTDGMVTPSRGTNGHIRVRSPFYVFCTRLAGFLLCFHFVILLL